MKKMMIVILVLVLSLSGCFKSDLDKEVRSILTDVQNSAYEISTDTEQYNGSVKQNKNGDYIFTMLSNETQVTTIYTDGVGYLCIDDDCSIDETVVAVDYVQDNINVELLGDVVSEDDYSITYENNEAYTLQENDTLSVSIDGVYTGEIRVIDDFVVEAPEVNN